MAQANFILQKMTETTKKRGALLALTLGALGVVYGDIGTSPLYAINEIFFGHGGVVPNADNVIGAISLVVWALTIVVAIKYIIFVLRADNEGEGGVFALFGLLREGSTKMRIFLLGLLVLAAGLLFGDGIITPAISVLSAVEGLNVATPDFQPYIVPLTAIILTILFAFQWKGTAKVGRIFGPVISVWFLSIGLLGLRAVIHDPYILEAFNPLRAVEFLSHEPFVHILFILGAVMLAITGGEALYADMGHFGAQPIRLGWFSLVYPALLLNYLGQGAFLLSGATVINNNIFYSLVPSMLIYPMVILATLATIIASQALISGAFSLTAQGVGLSLLPRVTIVHTHEEHGGQIYVPFVNRALYLGCLLLVFLFKSSTNLASAYGLAVSGVMVATSLAMIVIARELWKWSWWKILVLWVPLAFVDLTFVTANSLKFLEGGFIPLGIGLFLFTIMKTWQWGRRATLEAYTNYPRMTMHELVAMREQGTASIPRTMVALAPNTVTSLDDPVPPVFQVFWKRYRLVPRDVIFLSVKMTRRPYLHGERYQVKKYFEKEGVGTIYSVQLNFGFMEEPDVEGALEGLAAHHDINVSDAPDEWLFRIVQENILPADNLSWFNRARFALFRLLLKNSDRAHFYFGVGRDVGLTIESFPMHLGQAKPRVGPSA